MPLDGNQSGFSPTYYCINQLISKTLNTLKLLMLNPPKRFVEHFQIRLTHSIEFGFKTCYMNSKAIALMAIYIT